MPFYTPKSQPEIPTLGVEIEYQIIDTETLELSSDTSALLEEGAAIYGEYIKPEFHAPMVECITTVCSTVAEIREQVGELRRTIIGLAQKRNLCIAAASTHPTSHWKDVKLTPGERYLQIQNDFGDIARSNLIYGMHCHVGIEDPEARIGVMNAARYFLPYILSLTASSPFWQGRDTGLATTRTGIFRRFPRTGMPDYYNNFAEFENYVNLLIETGSIDNAKKIYWDIRPHPFFPTIEFRIMDTPTTVRETAAVIAFIQIMSTRLVNLWHRNMGYRLFRRAMIAENMYRAMRYGINAEFIDLSTKKVLPAKELIMRYLDDWSEEIKMLGVEEEVGTLYEILEKGNSADRQRKVFAETNDLQKVTAHLIAETQEGVI